MRKRRRSRSLRANASPRAWLSRNLQALLASLGRLRQRPLGNLMSILVIAIAMALPTGLYLLVDNLQRLSQSWDGSISATLFLVPGVSDTRVSQLTEHLRNDPAIAELRHLPPEEALAEFRRHSGLAEALDLLEENPLPHVILIQLDDDRLSRQALSLLLQNLKNRPEVESAVADLEWVSRFQAMVNILQRSALLLSLLLALAVLLVIGNTIRLEILGRRKEIEIMKLVGGSNAFIRRPFLYEGFWYGLLGGLGALLLVELSRQLLQGPVSTLSSLYESGFTLRGADPETILAVLLCGCSLGVAGAWIAVQQQLAEIEPS